MVPEALEGIGNLSRKEGVSGKEPMPEGIKADYGLPFRRLWSG